MELNRLTIRCSGWSYKDWQGVFYPKDVTSKDYLKFYSGVFDCVELGWNPRGGQQQTFFGA